jgi:spermidine synthase
MSAIKTLGGVVLLGCGLGLASWIWWPAPKTRASLPNPCPANTNAVYTMIEVCNSRHVDCFSSTTLNAPAWANRTLEEQLSSDVLAARQEQNSGRLHLRQTEVASHMEVLTCDLGESKVGPIDSYHMATTAQKVLGGGPMRWSTEVTSADSEDDDLQLYFNSLSNISKHKELVANMQSNFSHAEIWRIGNSTRLLLNNVIMSDSADERIYHEMLVHPALLAAEQPQRVLIIGGGEGATLREVLHDSRVQHVTMVDIDEGLVNICKKHLPMMHQGSFASPKATVLFEDGVKFVARSAPESFDVVIVDGVDYDEDDDIPKYGDLLFQDSFYENIWRVLRPGGVLVQYISGVDKQENSETLLEVGFTDTQHLCVDVESFFGAGACFMLSSKAGTEYDESLFTRLQAVQTRLPEFAPEGNWSYLTADTLRSCVGVQSRLLKGGSAGRGGARGRGTADHSNKEGPQLFTLLLLAFVASQ